MDIQEKENYVDYNNYTLDMIDRPDFGITEHITPYTTVYAPDTRRVLYAKLYLKRKKRVKRCYKIIAFMHNKVQNDYFVTFSNERKFFFEMNTGITKYHYKKLKDHPLTSIGRLKRNIMFRATETYYLSHKFFILRNITFKMFTNQYKIISFNTFARYLNKLLFLKLIHCFKAISFKKGPLLIHYKYRRKKRIKLYTSLGYKIRIKKYKLKRMLKRKLLPMRRYKRRARRKKKKLLRKDRIYFIRVYDKKARKYPFVPKKIPCFRRFKKRGHSLLSEKATGFKGNYLNKINYKQFRKAARYRFYKYHIFLRKKRYSKKRIVRFLKYQGQTFKPFRINHLKWYKIKHNRYNKKKRFAIPYISKKKTYKLKKFKKRKDASIFKL